ncbi:uncharacterized protein LOC128551959 [Mercenaria mercenaria]|uniref:uncharacterized protein LOC128551959 n=1 Tax=Mercenaria mercenaria TaxID=6596 RepID=UPI00234E8CEE|nr:uncharacterized protein LOC128551959 [Mercenaria mercenaria]
MFNVVIFVLLCIVTVVSCREIQPSDNQQICLPFNAYIIWDRSNEEDTFDVQVHYVLQIIDNTPEGTSIRLDTVDEKLRNVMDTIKVNGQKQDWIHSTTNVTQRLSEYNIISYNSLKEAISSNFQKNETVAEEIVFIVNDKSEIDDEERAFRELKRKKVFVVFHGTKSQASKFWTNPATDKHHVLKPNENIDENKDAFLNLSCRGNS